MNNPAETRSLKSNRNHAFVQSALETGIAVASGVEMLLFSLLAAKVDFAYYPAILVMMGVGYVSLNRAKRNIDVAGHLQSEIDSMNEPANQKTK